MHIVRWIRMDSAVGCHAFGTRHGSLVRPVTLVTRCFCTLLWFCDLSGFQHWVQINTVEVIWCPHSSMMFLYLWEVGRLCLLSGIYYDICIDLDGDFACNRVWWCHWAWYIPPIHSDPQLHRHFCRFCLDFQVKKHLLCPVVNRCFKSMHQPFQPWMKLYDCLQLLRKAIDVKLYAWIHALPCMSQSYHVVFFCILWLFQVCFSWPLLAATFTQFAVEGGLGVFCF